MKKICLVNNFMILSQKNNKFENLMLKKSTRGDLDKNGYYKKPKTIFMCKMTKVIKLQDYRH